MSSFAPIGVFDSGFGGLSVLRALRARMPAESFVYLGDSAFCPYGDKDDVTIESRVHAFVDLLFEEGCKAAVIACNTACAVALVSLRARRTEPIIGLEPAVKPAARRTKTGKVVVLATPRTARGEKLRDLIELHGSGVRVETVPAPGLVDLIESGRGNSREIRYLLSNLLEGPLARGCDVVVLGCTHYPFLAGTIAEIVGPSVAIVSSGSAVARQTDVVLRRAGLAAGSSEPGECRYITTGDTFAFDMVASDLMGAAIRSESILANSSAPIH